MTGGVAAFDFDKTLTTRDSLLPFLARVTGWPRVVRALAGAAPALRHGRNGYKTRVLGRTVAGRQVADLQAMGAAYAAQLVAESIRPEMRERLAWHRKQEHELLIVSASLDVYLVEVGRLLGVDHVFCSTLVVDDHGIASGELAGGNCRGPRKAELVRRHLQDRPERELWAYGDSSGDDAMLALATHGYRVGRGGELRRAVSSRRG